MKRNRASLYGQRVIQPFILAVWKARGKTRSGDRGGITGASPSHAEGVTLHSPASRSARRVGWHGPFNTPTGFDNARSKRVAFVKPLWGLSWPCLTNPACAARRWAVECYPFGIAVRPCVPVIGRARQSGLHQSKMMRVIVSASQRSAQCPVTTLSTTPASVPIATRSSCACAVAERPGWVGCGAPSAMAKNLKQLPNRPPSNPSARISSQSKRCSW